MLLLIIKGFSKLLKSFFNLLYRLIRPLFILLGKLLKFAALLAIRIFYKLKKYLRQIFPNQTIKPIYLFINKYIGHVVMILLVFIISFANVFTSETRAENYGEKSILYGLVTGSSWEEEYIEESLIVGDSQITSYFEETGIAAPETGTVEEETGIAISEESASLEKPQIPSLQAIAPPTRDKIIEYVVQQGDTVSTIADRFGITQNTILWENNLSGTSYIRPGQTLRILPTSGISYKIVKNDNLAKISSRYKIDADKIIEFNRLADESDIQVGQQIIIPEAKPYYPPVAAKPKISNITKIFTPAQTHVDVPAGDKMAWPTTARRISQYFNWRHIGLDIDGEFGDPIWAADDGVVIKSVCMKTGYGCHVIIDHGNGKTTLYAHFQKLYVKEGQSVVRGDVLGEQGSTGYSTGAHLHFEVRFGGKRYNPLSYIK